MTKAWRSLKHARFSPLPTHPRHGASRIVRAFPFRPGFDLMEDRTLLSTFAVNNTSDSGPGSLRQAIIDSNSAVGATNTIDFDISGTGVQTIAPLTSLPAIANPVLIDGTSQPAYNGTPLIELNGSRAGGGDGFTITAAGVTVCGLDVDSFSQGAGIHLTGAGATGDWIYGNLLGTDPTGTMAEGNQYGVEIDAGATNNLVGTKGDGVNDVAQRNVISGNGDSGVFISGQGTDGNIVAGNFIGTDLTGTQALGNAGSNDYLANAGVTITAGASGNWIGVKPRGGAVVADEGNLISGNDAYGIQIVATYENNQYIGSNDNVIAGDKIGTDVTGAVALGNAEDGVFVQASSGNTIGGTGAGEADIISANGTKFGYGIQISSSSENLVEGSIIGTDATGTKALGNGQGGVEIDNSNGTGAIDNTIGGATAAAGNLITDNEAAGVIVTDNSGIGNDSVVGNQITANRIFGNTGQAIDLDDDGVTENSTTPRVGANMLQNFPIIVTTASGQLEGWLAYSLPDAIYRIDLYASADYGPGGSGEAEDYLGSLDVTTDSRGDAVFDVPFASPAGLPIVTATATDPQGDTSEVSALRQTTLQSPSSTVLAVANQANAITTTPADVIAIRDPDAGPLDPAWSLTVTVSNGSLSLPAIAGVTGSGDGTASLSYSGTLSALNEALDGLTYTPPAGPHDLATVSVGAASLGTPSLATQFVITDGVRLVDTTADSGPGSLRQAILDANTVTGKTVTIDFAIPGSGVRTVELASPLPAISASVLIAGSSQPEYAGTPLIALGGESNDLTITAGNLTILGLSLNQVAIDVSTSEYIVAIDDNNGLAAGLTLLDSQGNVLVRSEGISLTNRASVLDEYLPSGTYSVATSGVAGVGNASLSISLTPASSPSQPVPVTGLATNAGDGYPVDQTIAMVAGDFTGDGILDIATPSGLFLGLGDGEFQYPPISLGLPDLVSSNFILNNYTDIITGDFTGNGKLDLALTDQATDAVVIILGNGNGTFQPPMSFAAGIEPQSLVAGDFNGDGKLDLAVADFGITNVAGQVDPGGGVSILLGNGDGTFGPPTLYAAGNNPVSVIAADFTGDGKLDLAVADDGDQNGYASAAGGVSVLLGDGNGTFRPAVAYAAGAGPASLVAGDFAGNGKVDLAVADPGDVYTGSEAGNDPGGVYVLLNNGDGTFQNAIAYASDLAGGTAPGSIVAGVFTDNGKVDLAIGGDEIDELLILKGNGDGTFEPPIGTPLNLPENGGSLYLSIVSGDFDGDGRLDLAVAGATASNNGLFGPSPPPGPTSGAGANGLGTPNSFEVLLGNGDGTFEQGGKTENGGGFARAISADFNGDGNLDLATYNYATDEVSILLGNSGGSFHLASQFESGVPLATGDFNGDGRIDLATAAPDGVSIRLGNGDGTFQSATTYSLGFSPTAVVAGDFSDNNILDMAAVGTAASGPGGELAILMGNGDGTFRPPVNYAVGVDPGNILAGDFAGNGKLDLAFAIDSDPTPGSPSEGQSNAISVMAGNGDGTFQAPVNYLVVSSKGIETISSIVAEDLTGNGKLDLVASAEVITGGTLATLFFGNTVSILMGNGNGTFQASQTLLKLPVPLLGGVLSALSLVAGDFNGDGVCDLAFDNPNTNQISVLLGNSAGTAQSVLNDPANGAFSLVAGDFAGNGRLDLALVSPDSATILLGNGDGTFTSASQLAITPQANPLVADVNGDGKDDVLVVNGSGEILYRQGVPGQPGTFEPPIIVNPPLPDGSNPYASRDIAWLPNTDRGPVLASVDTADNAIIFYAYRDGGFVRLSGSLHTGQFPEQIIAADLNGTGWDDLVVRNAADGTLSVFYGTSFIGPVDPKNAQNSLPTFLPPVTLTVGLGVSDVEAVDATSGGALDLVATSKLTGQVSVLYNLGNGTFAAPLPYRAGTGLSEIDPGATPEVTSLEATAGVAAGPLTPGGPSDLVTINPGSNTLDVLDGLGGELFANPTAIETQSPAEIVRMGDFTGNGLDDLAVLSANGISIYLANGKGGFLSPTTYAVPADADGLTVADLLRDGKLDLLVGDAYGDVLVLLGQGDGSFEPYHQANQSIELAVADLTGNGSKDIIYADQSLDRVVVDYGAGKSSVLANQSTGLLDPGAVALADLNGDGVPDLIVANSGSNNVLIYPGLGNGQFGPGINGGNGYFVGTDPVGITVADLTGNGKLDLVVADEGSNQVSILDNTSQQGGAISFAAGPRLNSGGSGPVSTVVGNFTGGAVPDILVTNSQSNDVALLQGLGQGFFDDTNPRTYSVGTDPGPTFVGDFNGQTDLVTVNAGSNDLTLISGFEGSNPVATTISSAGLDPATAFEFSSDNGFDNLVVGNGGDGVLALFEGSSEGLTLSASETVSGLPSPSSLAFASLSGGQVQFYAATEGQEAAALVALSLGGGEISAISALASPASSGVAQLVPLQESSLALVGTLLTLTIESSSGETEALGAIAVSAAAPASLGQSIGSRGLIDGLESDESDLQPGDARRSGRLRGKAAPTTPAWQRYTLGTDEAIERFDREHPDLSPAENNTPSQTNPVDGPNETGLAPREDGDPGLSWISTVAQDLRAKCVDRVIERLGDRDRLTVSRGWWNEDATVWAGLALAATDPISTAQATCSAFLRSLAVFHHAPDLADQDAVSPLPIHGIPEGGWAVSGRSVATLAVVALVSVVAGYGYFGPAARGANSKPFSEHSR